MAFTTFLCLFSLIIAKSGVDKIKRERKKLRFNPLVTIITVSYNSENTIEKTIKSVLNQTYTNIEYIIIDNLSTDKTIEIIKSYKMDFEKKGFKYKWISEKDNGIYYAMNKGIHMANGRIIGIINSDDWYNEDTVKYAVKTFLQYNSDIVYGNIKTIISFKNTLYYKIEKSSKDLSQLKKQMSIKHPSVFVRASIYSKIGNFNTKFKIAADWEFLNRCYNKKIKFAYINKELANFLYGGMSCKYSYNQLFEAFIIRFKNKKRIYALVKLVQEYSKHLIKIVLKYILPSNIFNAIFISNLKKQLKNLQKVK